MPDLYTKMYVFVCVCTVTDLLGLLVWVYRCAHKWMVQTVDLRFAKRRTDAQCWQMNTESPVRTYILILNSLKCNRLNHQKEVIWDCPMNSKYSHESDHSARWFDLQEKNFYNIINIWSSFLLIIIILYIIMRHSWKICLTSLASMAVWYTTSWNWCSTGASSR